jgi:hypothetical protein
MRYLRRKSTIHKATACALPDKARVRAEPAMLHLLTSTIQTRSIDREPTLAWFMERAALFMRPSTRLYTCSFNLPPTRRGGEKR